VDSVAMSDSNQTDGLPNTRRERGKIAQREYRKRHASKFHGLQEENKRLRDAIRAVSDAYAAGARFWPELEAAVSHANDVAGLEPLPAGRSDMSAAAVAAGAPAPQAPATTPGGFLNNLMASDAHAHSHAHSQTHPNSQSHSHVAIGGAHLHSAIPMCPNAGVDTPATAPAPSPLMHYRVTMSPSTPSSSNNGVGISSRHAQNTVNSISTSSNIVTGPTTSDPVRLSHPDAPLPFVNDGVSTISGLISWACTSYAVSIWRTVHRGSAAATTQLEDFLDEHMLGALRLMTDQAYLASLARARARQCALSASPMSRRSVGTGGGSIGMNRNLGGPEYAHDEDHDVASNTAPNPTIDLDELRERYHKLAASAPNSWDPHLRHPNSGSGSNSGPGSSMSISSKPDVWRSPTDVEEHLRRQATPDEFDRVRAVVQGRRSAGDYDVLCVGRYVVSLCANFVCSPAGPRWHAMFMTMATGLMLRRLRGESVADAMSGGT
jgi:hypothetical protein